MQSLPNELLAQIASHLESQPSSITKFNHEPTAHLAYSQTELNNNPLKSLSLVSWRLRKIVLPILFRYVRIPLDKEPQWVPTDARLVDSMQSELSTLSNHEFMLYTKLRGKFKSSAGGAFEPAMDDVLIQLCRIQDGDEFLKRTDRKVWLPHLSSWFPNFKKFAEGNELKHHIRSVVVCTDEEFKLRYVVTALETLAREVSRMWNQIFELSEPERFVVAAPPKTMAALLESGVATNDSWAFEMKMHYIEFVQTLPSAITSNTEIEKNSRQPSDIGLIHRRPWSHIGYNEGSSITAYSIYEFQFMTTPRILEILLDRLAKNSKSCANLSSFSLIAVFPLSSHITQIVSAMHRIPSIRKITLQLAPGPENDLLSNGSKRRKAQSSDFWSEWRLGYKALADMDQLRRVYSGEDGTGWEPALEEIVSRDCYTKQLGEEVKEVVEHYLKQAKLRWKSDGVGRWVRDESEVEDVD
ncbi:hypothetical protein G6011_09504 [Alternaria panax]|uniref:F-box domain-containing protein n=1 Tax=Alternaria panax TaxID=48097 RepID=A0AAD4IBA4_9PLEO|nr:hypothetical protein G6011_09504 [Alternaria panax]